MGAGVSDAVSLTRRHLTFTFQLGTGSFGESGANTVTVEGLRASASVTKAGGVSMAQATIRVYGLTLDLMNQLSTLGKPLVTARNNRIAVAASSDDEPAATVFQGIISDAWVDMAGAPDGVFEVSAHTGLIEALKPVEPISFPGSADVATIMAGLATKMGYMFENTGVTAQLSNPYFPGTARMQAEACARAAGINWILDNQTLAIWPKDSARGALAPLISPATGLVGYPAHTANGISLTTLYNPAIVFGARVQVDSVLKPAVGVWTVFKVAHDLESETPDGQWFTHLDCALPGQGGGPLAR